MGLDTDKIDVFLFGEEFEGFYGVFEAFLAVGDRAIRKIEVIPCKGFFADGKILVMRFFFKKTDDTEIILEFLPGFSLRNRNVHHLYYSTLLGM